MRNFDQKQQALLKKLTNLITTANSRILKDQNKTEKKHVLYREHWAEVLASVKHLSGYDNHPQLSPKSINQLLTEAKVFQSQTGKPGKTFYKQAVTELLELIMEIAPSTSARKHVNEKFLISIAITNANTNTPLWEDQHKLLTDAERQEDTFETNSENDDADDSSLSAQLRNTVLEQVHNNHQAAMQQARAYAKQHPSHMQQLSKISADIAAQYDLWLRPNNTDERNASLDRIIQIMSQERKDPADRPEFAGAFNAIRGILPSVASNSAALMPAPAGGAAGGAAAAAAANNHSSDDHNDDNSTHRTNSGDAPSSAVGLHNRL